MFLEVSCSEFVVPLQLLSGVPATTHLLILPFWAVHVVVSLVQWDSRGPPGSWREVRPLHGMLLCLWPKRDCCKMQEPDSVHVPCGGVPAVQVTFLEHKEVFSKWQLAFLRRWELVYDQVQIPGRGHYRDHFQSRQLPTSPDVVSQNGKALSLLASRTGPAFPCVHEWRGLGSGGCYGSSSTSEQHACAVLAFWLSTAACSHIAHRPLSTISLNRQSHPCVAASHLSLPEVWSHAGCWQWSPRKGF